MCTFEERLDELKIVLMMKPELTFFSQILLQCRISKDTSIPTAGINGTHLIINPDWFMSLDFNHQLFVLFHEAEHPAFLDMERCGSRDHKLWNMACDYFNNAHIDTKINSITYPSEQYIYNGKPMKYLRDTKYDGMDKEEIYDLLQEDKDSQNQDNALDGDLGNGEGDEGMSDEERQEMIEEVRQAVQQAAITAEQSGQGNGIPDNVKQYLDNLYNPKLPWNKLLARYMQDMLNRDDYSYSRPNPHYLHQGLYIPSLHSESLGHVVVAADESCSVSDEDVKLYLGAIHDIWNNYKPSELDVIGFTTGISKHIKLSRGMSADCVNFRGHGGTHIPVVFDHLHEQGIKPEVLIVFSDMESDFPRNEPEYPVIWISVGNPSFKAPFGTTVYIDNK